MSRALTTKQEASKEKPLSLQRQSFVDHLCTDACWNGAEAARMAKYSVKTARIQAAQLLTIPSIQEAIAKKKAELYSSSEATVEEVLQDHRLAKRIALDKGDLTTFTRNNEDMGKTLTMYGDRILNEGKGEAPDQLSDADLATLRTMAKAITDKSLKGPQLAQGERKGQEGTIGHDTAQAQGGGIAKGHDPPSGGRCDKHSSLRDLYE